MFGGRVLAAAAVIPYVAGSVDGDHGRRGEQEHGMRSGSVRKAGIGDPRVRTLAGETIAAARPGRLG
jgi:hypothetical protein